MENQFLPEGYKIPENSNYFKFKDGENNFRVLSSAITGFEYWNTDNKPVRSKLPFAQTPGIKLDKEGLPTKVKHFWAFVVYNYDANKIQIMEITQSSIQEQMKAIIDKWKDPKKFDFTVKRSGTGFETEYQTLPNPHTELDPNIAKQYEMIKIDLNALFDGLDPFATSAPEQASDGQIEASQPNTGEITVEDLNF